MPTPRWKLALALVLVWGVWGSTYFAIRVALEGFAPFGMAAVRLCCAGLVLLGWGRVNGEPWPRFGGIWPLMLAGVLMFMGGNGSVVWAEQHVSSGLVAILVGAVPLYAAVLGRVVGLPVTLRQWAGIALGVTGIVALHAEDELAGDAFTTAMVTCGSIAWAAGSLLSKLRNEATPTMASGVQMVSGSLALGIAALLTREALPADPPLRSILAVLYLFAFGSVLAFSAYTWLLRNTTLALATSYAYVNPVVAVVLGMAFGGEHLDASGWLGMGLIVAAVGVVTRR